MGAALFMILAAVWVVFGSMWLRRAYIGEKMGAMITLSHPTGDRMTRRERLMQIVLGSASLIIAILYVARGLHW
jgi:hypothetical protein